jgi:hypothetical protein
LFLPLCSEPDTFSSPNPIDWYPEETIAGSLEAFRNAGSGARATVPQNSTHAHPAE